MEFWAFADAMTVNIAALRNIFIIFQLAHLMIIIIAVFIIIMMVAEFRRARTYANLSPTVLYRCRQRTNRRPNRRKVQDHSTDNRVAGDH